VPRITLAKGRGVKRTVPQGCHATARSPLHAHVSQHETGAASAADAVAEIIRRGARVGPDPHLVENTGVPRVRISVLNRLGS